MIIPKKSKFTAFEWRILKNHLEGYCGEIHHCCGRQYEKLAYLKPMSSNDHRGNGHKKHIHGMPKKEAKENMDNWRAILGNDFEWFEQEHLVVD